MNKISFEDHEKQTQNQPKKPQRHEGNNHKPTRRHFLRSTALAASAIATGTLTAWTPQIRKSAFAATDYDPGEDVLICTHRVKDYGAVADDGKDDTQAFQKAIDAARDAGGGIVYAPVGPLHVPRQADAAQRRDASRRLGATGKEGRTRPDALGGLLGEKRAGWSRLYSGATGRLPSGRDHTLPGAVVHQYHPVCSRDRPQPECGGCPPDTGQSLPGYPRRDPQPCSLHQRLLWHTASRRRLDRHMRRRGTYPEHRVLAGLLGAERSAGRADNRCRTPNATSASPAKRDRYPDRLQRRGTSDERAGRRL